MPLEVSMQIPDADSKNSYQDHINMFSKIVQTNSVQELTTVLARAAQHNGLAGAGYCVGAAQE